MDINFMIALHSGVRWLVILAGVVVLAKSVLGLATGGKYTSLDTTLWRVLTGALGIQFLLGLIVLIWRGVTLGGDAGSLYWGRAITHALVMFGVVVGVSIASVRARKGETDRQKFITGVVALAVASLLTLYGVGIFMGWS